MKKIIYVLSLVIVFGGFASVTHANVQCGNPADSVEAVTYISCGGTVPSLLSNAWNVPNWQLPHVKPGQTITLSNGVSDTCPAYFSQQCVDISHTQYWMDRWGK